MSKRLRDEARDGKIFRVWTPFLGFYSRIFADSNSSPVLLVCVKTDLRPAFDKFDFHRLSISGELLHKSCPSEKYEIRSKKVRIWLSVEPCQTISSYFRDMGLIRFLIFSLFHVRAPIVCYISFLICSDYFENYKYYSCHAKKHHPLSHPILLFQLPTFSCRRVELSFPAFFNLFLPN